jgi:hypothetical protein
MLKAVHKLRRWCAKKLGRRQPTRTQHISVEGIFTHIHANNRWKDPESASGSGSTLAQTRVLRERLPRLFKDLGVASVLDIPCGDFHWLSQADLGVREYIGADIVPTLVEANQARHGLATDRRSVHFAKLDLLTSLLPRTDLILCRDCLVHFADCHVKQALTQVKRSGATYLLTTTFTSRRNDRDIVTGQWRPLNLEAPPFGLPAPMLRIDEQCSEADGRYADKALGLWRVADLPYLTGNS